MQMNLERHKADPWWPKQEQEAGITRRHKKTSRDSGYVHYLDFVKVISWLYINDKIIKLYTLNVLDATFCMLVITSQAVKNCILFFKIFFLLCPTSSLENAMT